MLILQPARFQVSLNQNELVTLHVAAPIYNLPLTINHSPLFRVFQRFYNWFGNSGQYWVLLLA